MQKLTDIIEELAIEDSELKIIRNEIYNVLGEKILAESQITDDIRWLKPGIYFVRLISEKKTVTKKIVVVKY